jgi:hemerythrin-like metal-binding protein
MGLIEWDNSYSVGNTTIDEQHKKLIKLINEFNESTNSQAENKSISKLLAGLKQYIVFHFKTEELYLRLCNYPDYEQHKKEHERFIKKVENIEHKFASGTSTEMDEITNYFTNWITHHIKDSDVRYSSYIINIEQD